MKNIFQRNTPISFISREDYPDYLYCEISKRLAYIIRALYDMGHTHFLVGTRTNFDKLAICFLMSLKESKADVTVEMVYGSKYRKRMLGRISRGADKTTVLSNSYFKYDSISVEDYLIENSAIVLCCFTGKLFNLIFEQQRFNNTPKCVYNILNNTELLN